MISAGTLVTIDPSLLITMGTSLERAVSDAPWLSYAATVFGIDTPLRLGHWLGQIMTETGQGNLMSEVGQSSSTGGRGWIQLTGRLNRSGYTNYLARPTRTDRDRVPYVDVRNNLSALTRLPHRTHSAGYYWRHPYVDTAGRPQESSLADSIADQGMTERLVRRITTEVVRPGTPRHSERWENSERAYELVRAGRASFTRCPGGRCPDLAGISPPGDEAAGSNLFWPGGGAGSRYSQLTPATFGSLWSNVGLPELAGSALAFLGLGGVLATGDDGGTVQCVTAPCIQPDAPGTIAGVPTPVVVGGVAIAAGLVAAALTQD